MHLVYIESRPEQEFLVDNTQHNDGSWIGLSGFSWLDGSELTYSDFGGSSAFNEESLCFRIQDWDSRWSDRSCSKMFSYICEKQGEQAPTDGGPVTTAQSMSDQAHRRSMSIKLLAANSVLNETYVLTSYTASSLTRCAKQCLAEPTCSCFTFIEHERACFLGVAFCGSDQITYDGSCYHFPETKSDFSSAKSSCETDPGWHLVYIGSQEEQDFLERNIPNQEEGYWIGLSSVTWLDGSHLTYNNFGACAANHVENNGSCYFFSEWSNQFTQSRSSCEDKGMHLVYIGSQEEQDFLVSHLVDTEEYWIGLSSLVWQDGSHLVYNNILYHDYAFDNGGSCFRMYPSDLLWYGKSCSDSYHYICEKEIEQAPTDGGPVTTAQSMSDQAHRRSMSIKLLAANSVLNEAYVLTSYTASSLTRCAKQCLAEAMCSCFTFIEHERACLLDAGVCEIDYVAHDGSCYYFSDYQSDFSTSQSSCESMGMHLVFIESENEQAFLEEKVYEKDYWIGLSSVSWLDGSAIHYINFPSLDQALDEGGRCFRLFDLSLKGVCLGMHLVYIGSQEEEQFLMDEQGSDNEYWIGNLRTAVDDALFDHPFINIRHIVNSDKDHDLIQ
eukprot:XP_011667401.1 PREDICTED: uncharacterized protein LOC105439747 [Strongylocentrotus purpuratus]